MCLLSPADLRHLYATPSGSCATRHGRICGENFETRGQKNLREKVITLWQPAASPGNLIGSIVCVCVCRCRLDLKPIKLWPPQTTLAKYRPKVATRFENFLGTNEPVGTSQLGDTGPILTRWCHVLLHHIDRFLLAHRAAHLRTVFSRRATDALSKSKKQETDKLYYGE